MAGRCSDPGSGVGLFCVPAAPMPSGAESGRKGSDRSSMVGTVAPSRNLVGPRRRLIGYCVMSEQTCGVRVSCFQRWWPGRSY
jgi:hypothetical protein